MPKSSQSRQETKAEDSSASASGEISSDATAVLQRAQEMSQALTPADVLHLQRSIGNAATQKLLSRRLSLQPKRQSKPDSDQPASDQPVSDHNSVEQKADAFARHVARRVPSRPVQRDEERDGDPGAGPLGQRQRPSLGQSHAEPMKRAFVKPVLPRQITRPRPIQRLLMTDKQWKEKSSRFGKARSALLLEIDIALAAYNKAQDQIPSERVALLNTLLEKIRSWENHEKDGNANRDASSRRQDVAFLKQRADEEKAAIEAVIQKAANPTTAVEARVGAQELYHRGAQQLISFLSLAPTAKNRDQAQGYWQQFRTDAMRIEHATGRLDLTNNDNHDAHLASLGLRESMRAFRTISYRHLGVQRRDSDKTNLDKIRTRLGGLMDQIRTPDGSEDFIFLTKAYGEIGDYADLAGADEETDNKLRELDDEGFDFELIEEMLGAVDISTTMLGFQGTGGKGNEGFADFYKGDPAQGQTDERSNLEKDVASSFSKLSPSGTKGQDIMSGSSDMANAVGNLGAEGIAFFQAWKTYKDPDASESEKLQAKLQMTKTPFGVISNVLKFTGGALTAHRGGDTNQLKGSGFGFSATGTDVSTDVKMAGDFAGLFAGIIDSIAKVIDLVKFIKDGGGDNPKAQRFDTRKNFEAVGNLLRKYTGAVSSIASNFKAAAKLGYQIAGEGQTAATDASSVVNLGGVVPGLQLAFGIMEAIQNAYKLTRIGLRRMVLTDKIRSILDKGASGNLKELQTVEFAHESLVKRSVRIGINLGHALASIIAGGFNLSGIGLAPGMVVSLSSTAMKIGQVGLRKAKQYGRDRQAAKREERGLSEGYGDWERRKRLEAAQVGKWQQFKTAIKIQFAFNWDKTSENKESTNREVALEILRMDDTDIYDALGVTDALAVEGSSAKRLEIVTKALKKRD